MEIKRDLHVNRLIDRKGNGLVKVITGIRRCGKSYLLFTLFKKHLLSTGVPEDHIIELAFDDHENKALRDPAVFYPHIKGCLKDGEQYYVLLDEIQMLGEFESVLNGLLRRPKVDVYVTGSNARFLAKDVITEFRGRGDQVHIQPLSFAEFMSVYPGSNLEGWREYCRYGGLPLILSRPTEESKSAYLKSVFTETYLADIVGRNRIRHPEELNELLDILSSSVGSLTNPLRLANTFKSVKKSDISRATVVKYLECLCDSFIIDSAQRYDIRGNRYIGTPLKYYFADVGLRNARLNFRQQEETHLMENIIFNELKTRGFNIDVGVVETREPDGLGSLKRKQLEIDFVCNRAHERYYIQSALALPDREKTEQEQRPLLNIGDTFKKIIVVRDPFLKRYHTPKGVLVMSVFDFLLDPASLEK